MRSPRVKLVREWKLINCDLILVGMPGPCAVHQAIRFVFLVFLQGCQRPPVQFRSLTAGVERGHAANRQHAAFVANLRHEFTQVLKKWHVVRDRIAVRQHPCRVIEIEVNQAGHVIPAAKIQSEDVFAQVIEKFLHLKRQRM